VFATKGLRVRRSVRTKGSADLEECSRKRVFGSVGASTTKGPQTWRSVRDKGSSDPAERPRRKALRAGVAWIGKPSGGTVREVSGVLFGARARTTASTHLMPPFNFARWQSPQAPPQAENRISPGFRRRAPFRCAVRGANSVRDRSIRIHGQKQRTRPRRMTCRAPWLVSVMQYRVYAPVGKRVARGGETVNYILCNFDHS